MEFIEQFTAARRVSTPLICIRTFDPKSTTRAVMKSLGDKLESTPLLLWDAVHGLLPSNKIKNSPSVNAHQHTLSQGDLQQEQTRNLHVVLRALELTPAENTIIFVSNAHMQWQNQDPNIIQGIWNLRDVFKGRAVTLVLLTTPGAALPAELTNDVLTLDEPLPTVPQLEAVVADIFKAAGTPQSLTPEVTSKAIDALIGIPSFAAEQATAMSLTITKDAGTKSSTLDFPQLWTRKRDIINAAPGLKVYTGKEKLKDIGGVQAAKDFMSAVMTGRKAPKVIIWYDEIEKAYAGHGTDLSGTKTEMLGSQLTWHQEREIIGCLFFGIPGVSKSLLAKGLGNEYGVTTIGFDLPAMQAGHVGESNSNLRTSQKVVEATAGGQPILAIATSNNLSALPVELLRRFGLATFFFEQPTAEERPLIWEIHRKRLDLTGTEPNPKDEGWTGDDIRNCCEKAWMLNWTLAESAKYIVPITKSDAKRIQTIRSEAHNRYLSASKGGVYSIEEVKDGASVSAGVTAPSFADETNARKFSN